MKEIVYFLCDGWRNERLPPELMEGVQGEMPQYLFGKRYLGIMIIGCPLFMNVLPNVRFKLIVP